jgi:hypothetical protein
MKEDEAMERICRIGKWVINLGMITYIEIFASDNGSNVFFSGSESLRLEQPESDALLAVLHPSEIEPSPH